MKKIKFLSDYYINMVSYLCGMACIIFSIFLLFIFLTSCENHDKYDQVNNFKYEIIKIDSVEYIKYPVKMYYMSNYNKYDYTVYMITKK